MSKSKAVAEPVESEKAIAEPALPGPIPGLVIGRIVHVVRGGKLKAAIVADVHDAVRGDITAVVFEPVLGIAPQHPAQLSFAGQGAPPSEGQWAWMFDGQGTRHGRA